MTAHDVFRYDFRRLRRSWVPAVGVLVYTIVLGLPARAQSGQFQISRVLVSLTLLTQFLLPVLALALSVGAISGERDDKTARLQLGLPNSRREFVFGKLAARLAAVTVVVSAPAVVLSVLLVARYGVTWAPAVGVYWLLTLALGVTYTCIGVGLSAATDSKATAAGGGLMVYFVSAFAWSPFAFVSIPKLVEAKLRGTVPIPSGWSVYAEALNPVTAYLRALELAATRFVPFSPAPDTATLLQPPVMLLILVGWCCCAVAVGLKLFNRAEIQ